MEVFSLDDNLTTLTLPCLALPVLPWKEMEIEIECTLPICSFQSRAVYVNGWSNLRRWRKKKRMRRKTNDIDIEQQGSIWPYDHLRAGDVSYKYNHA